MCENCLPVSKEVVSLTKEIGEVKNECKNLNEKLDNFITEITSQTKRSVEAVQKQSISPKSGLGIRIHGLEEPKTENTEQQIDAEKLQISEVFKKLDVHGLQSVRDFYRIGKLYPNRPRTLIVRLSNPWEMRKVLAQTYFLQNATPGVFISRELSVEDALLEKRLLKKKGLI